MYQHRERGTMRMLCLALAILLAFVVTTTVGAIGLRSAANAQSSEQPTEESRNALGEDQPENASDRVFLAGFGAISLLVLVVLPLVAKCVVKNHNDGKMQKELRGLGLPRGSVRAMLALWMVGSYLLFLIYAATSLDKSNNDSIKVILTAFGPLVGAVLAFYFAGRASAPDPN